MRKIISLFCFLLPALAYADQLQIHPDVRPDAPDRYIVVKGDTLWDISGKFFKDPWKWPHIWGLNKDTIKDPHWIYPGDEINLDRTSGTLRIGQADTSKPGVTGVTRDISDSGDTGNIIRLSPKVHEDPSAHDAIPSIPANIIGPFLSQPLVIEEDALKDAPVMIGAREGRVVLASHDIGFAKGLTSDKGEKWQIYRPGKKFVDPETEEVLGIEAVYLGNAEVKVFAEVSTVAITHSVEETYKGDLLVAASIDAAGPYLPRAPETSISARVISIYGGVSQAGQNTAIVLNKGARDGLEMGHVLALYRKGEVVRESGRFFFSRDKVYTLPDERYGLVFVFRVFNKVSYALVMQTKLPVQLLDRALTP
ncbi:MAG: LysM peptidoglycan-binding domain-containing protein [Gallionella sp.]|nr:LysM peptidoglycan-binding domain-containing protein [Gallionella sp.]